MTEFEEIIKQIEEEDFESQIAELQNKIVDVISEDKVPLGVCILALQNVIVALVTENEDTDIEGKKKIYQALSEWSCVVTEAMVAK